jgi:hypothetical protein
METNTQVKLPAAPGAVVSLVFGILSGAFSCLFVGLIFAIIAMASAGKAKRAVAANPGAYSGIGMAKAGLILGIIGLVFSIIYTILWIFAASWFSGMFFFM